MQFSGRLVIIVALAVTVMLVSNIIAVKPITLFELPFEILGSNLYVVSAAIICFPVSYIISDVLTEVYGFRVARGVIWLGFACNLLMVILVFLGGADTGGGLLGRGCGSGVWHNTRRDEVAFAGRVHRVHRG